MFYQTSKKLISVDYFEHMCARKTTNSNIFRKETLYHSMISNCFFIYFRLLYSIQLMNTTISFIVPKDLFNKKNDEYEFSWFCVFIIRIKLLSYHQKLRFIPNTSNVRKKTMTNVQ